MSFVLLAVTAVIALFARAAVRRPSGHRPLWLPAMIGSELAPWVLGVLMVLFGGFTFLGWSGGWAGGTAWALGALAAAAFTGAAAPAL